MAKLLLCISLVLAVSYIQATEYQTIDTLADESALLDLPQVGASRLVEVSPGEVDQYSLDVESLRDPTGSEAGAQRDLNPLYSVLLRRPQMKRIYDLLSRARPSYGDNPYAKVLRFNKWADGGLSVRSNAENKLTKKEDPRLLVGAARKPFDTNFRPSDRMKKSRCVADDSRGVKNPSFCDMDAYFGAAGYRSDLWDIAGRR